MSNPDETLKNFIEERLDVDGLIRMGFIQKSQRHDYPAIAERVCTFFGYESVYEYGAHTTRAHISYADDGLSVNEEGELQQRPFITEFKGWMEE